MKKETEEIERAIQRRDSLLEWLKNHEFVHPDWDTNKKDYDLACCRVDMLEKRSKCAGKCYHEPSTYSLKAITNYITI